MRRVLLIPLLGILALPGCALGPHYAHPPLPGGAAFVSVKGPDEAPLPVPDRWWEIYQDPRLEALIAEALTANQDLAAAQAHLAGARALLVRARAARLPQTQIEAKGTYGRDPSTDLVLELTGRPPVTYWIYDTLLDASYELDLFGRVRRQIEAQRAQTQAIEAARDDLKVTVAAETARAYMAVCTSGEALEVTLRDLEVVTREAQITVARQEAGAGTELDVVRAQALVAQVRAQVPGLRAQRQVALLELTALLGRSPQDAPSAVLACQRPPPLKHPLPVGDARALLARRPDVREAERQLAAATAQIGVATADLFPRVELRGFFGGIAPEISEIATNAGLAWGLGPKITWTFPNVVGPLAELTRSRAAAREALAHFNSVALTALKETEQALVSYSAELAHHEELVKLDERARRAFELAHSQYVAGAASDLDLLTAESTLISAQQLLAGSDAALAEDQIRLFKVLGGGWAGPESPRP